MDQPQKILNKILDWAIKWRIKFNNNKFNVVHFRKP